MAIKQAGKDRLAKARANIRKKQEEQKALDFQKSLQIIKKHDSPRNIQGFIPLVSAPIPEFIKNALNKDAIFYRNLGVTALPVYDVGKGQVTFADASGGSLGNEVTSAANRELANLRGEPPQAGFGKRQIVRTGSPFRDNLIREMQDASESFEASGGQISTEDIASQIQASGLSPVLNLNAENVRQLTQVSPTPFVTPTETRTAFTESTGGLTQFNTGNPTLDKYLNEVYLPLMEAEFSNDPAALLKPSAFKAISDRIETTLGPKFTQAKTLIEEEFKLKQENIDLLRRQQLEPLTAKLGEIGTERTRLTEDVTMQRTREARNLQQAMKESADAYASRGRAFGGGRIEAERGLEEKSQENLADLARQEERRRQDLLRQEQGLQAQQGFLGEEFGLRGRELGTERKSREQELIDRRFAAEQAERQRLITQGQFLLEQPEFFNRSLT